MSRRARAVVGALALGALVGVAGCSDSPAPDEPTPSSTPSAAASGTAVPTTVRVKSSGISFEVPAGWQGVDVDQPGVDASLKKNDLVLVHRNGGAFDDRLSVRSEQGGLQDDDTVAQQLARLGSGVRLGRADTALGQVQVATYAFAQSASTLYAGLVIVPVGARLALVSVATADHDGTRALVDQVVATLQAAG